jgi:hypothetical protein
MGATGRSGSVSVASIVVIAVGLLATTACTTTTTGGGTGPSASDGGSAGSEEEGAGSGDVTEGKPTSLQATVVGGWAASGTNCASGTDDRYVYFLCPGGRIRGGGELKSPGGYAVTELVCGSYTVSPAVYSGCDDKIGCFPKVTANVTSTLIIGTEKDTDPNAKKELLYVEEQDALVQATRCKDGSNGFLFLERGAGGDVTDDYCESDACTAGSAGGSSCSGDCDCGRCWYCESGTCRYGGEGPYGCYRGCSG